MDEAALRRRLRQRFDFSTVVSRGLSCRQLSREEASRCFPGQAISRCYGKPLDAAELARRDVVCRLAHIGQRVWRQDGHGTAPWLRGDVENASDGAHLAE